MKELLDLILSFNIKKLFSEKTENSFIQFFRYAFVGGAAFLADYTVFVLVCQAGDTGLINILAVIAGFIAGTVINYFLARKFVFQKKSNIESAFGEFVSYSLVGVAGCVLNILILFFGTDILNINRYAAKLIAAFLVLFFDYAVRRFLLYTPFKKDRG